MSNILILILKRKTVKYLHPKILANVATLKRFWLGYYAVSGFGKYLDILNLDKLKSCCLTVKQFLIIERVCFCICIKSFRQQTQTDRNK